MRLPLHWRLLKWGDLATLKYGKALRSYRGVEGPYPVFGTNGQIGWHEEYLCPHPGVVVGRKGAYRGIHFSSKPFFVIDTAFYLSPLDRIAFDIKWAYYQLLDFDINKLDSGSAIPSTSREAFYEIPVLLPPVEVQRKIAGTLSAYDDLIENNLRRIRILEEMAQALYQEWFVEFRFPCHSAVSLADSALGVIPDGWRREPLVDHLSVLETGSRPKGGVAEIKGGVPSIGAESVVGAGQFDFAKTKYIPLEYFQKMKKGVLAARDVLVYKDGGKPGDFRPHVSFVGRGFPFDRMAINSHVYRLRAANNVSQEYLYYHLSSPQMMHWMHLHGTGAAVPSIARRDLMKLPLLIPSREVHDQFTQLAGDALSLILSLARKSKVLEAARNLLILELMSGELDVSALEINIGEAA